MNLAGSKLRECVGLFEDESRINFAGRGGAGGEKKWVVPSSPKVEGPM